MSRPRRVSDDEVLQAVGRAVSRVGHRALRLRDVSDESGLAPPTLVQRFGSKRALLAAFARRRARRAEGRGAADESGDPLRLVEDVLLRTLGAEREPAEVAHHLARYLMEVGDPDLHPDLARQARRRRKAVRGLLDRAVAEGRLRSDTRTGRLARTLESTATGALATWTVHRKRSVKRWVRREIRAVLDAHRSA